MFSRLIKMTMVAISMSPVLLTFWFKDFSKNYGFFNGLYFLLTFVLLVLILFGILKISENKFEIIPVNISEISNLDTKNVAFMFIYLIPLLEISQSMIFFSIILFFTLIYITNIYYFNPILGVLGYHQYKINVKGTTFILITKRILVNTNQIQNVVQLTDYILLEKNV